MMFSQTVLKSEINHKEFNFDQLQCNYTNTNQMKIITDYASNLKVTNYLAKKQGNIIRKVTQIHLEDKLIILQDNYDMQFLISLEPQQTKALNIPQSVPQCNLVKIQDEESFELRKQKQQRKKINKTLMPKKPKIRQNLESFQGEIKRDTKNIPRNIMRVFSKHLQSQDQQAFQAVKQKTQELGYNNTLISEMVKDSYLVYIFKQFLQGAAKEWLENSRIKDKESHVQAINIYLKMINESEAYTQNHGDQEALKLQNEEREMSL